MKSQTLVDIGNAHLDTVVDYTKKMVDANRIDAETAPSFINDLSDAMLETLNRFETVAQAASDASKAAGAAKKRGPKYAKTAKMREALSREGRPCPRIPIFRRWPRPIATSSRSDLSDGPARMPGPPS